MVLNYFMMVFVKNCYYPLDIGDNDPAAERWKERCEVYRGRSSGKDCFIFFKTLTIKSAKK